jgi:malonyl-CoA O-methyltransferase
MLNGLFVTGTDTGVGKTAVAAALMHRYREVGTLKYWKPIQTGIENDDDTATVQNLGCLKSEVFAPGIRLHRPLAPYLAAELSGVRITIPDLESCVADEPGSVRWVAEGAGGVLVPINDSEFMIDLMIYLSMPVLVVARSSLGTINHTLMTLEVLRERTLNVAGVVMVGEPNPGNRGAIQQFGEVEVVGEMPTFPKLTADALARWATMDFDPKGHLASCFTS